MVIRQWAVPVVLPALERDRSELEAAELLGCNFIEVRALVRERDGKTSRATAYWLNTATGKRFDFLRPKLEDIDIVDIAIALGNQCRYAGHTRQHYSVAEHCVILSHAASPEHAAWALMHDAAEAYVTDIPWPLKAAGLVPDLALAEKVIMRAICVRFGLDPVEPAEVKALDLEILDLEADALLTRHADWPRGTPREPRERLREVWRDWQRMEINLAHFKPPHAFLRRALELGLADDADYARLRSTLVPS